MIAFTSLTSSSYSYSFFIDLKLKVLIRHKILMTNKTADSLVALSSIMDIIGYKSLLSFKELDEESYTLLPRPDFAFYLCRYYLL